MTMPDESIRMAAGLVPSETLHRGETIVTRDGGSDGRGRSVFQSPTSRGSGCHSMFFRRALQSFMAFSPLHRGETIVTVRPMALDRAGRHFQSPTSRGNDCHVD